MLWGPLGISNQFSFGAYIVQTGLEEPRCSRDDRFNFVSKDALGSAESVNLMDHLLKPRVRCSFCKPSKRSPTRSRNGNCSKHGIRGRNNGEKHLIVLMLISPASGISHLGVAKGSSS